MTDTTIAASTAPAPSRAEIAARWWREMQDTLASGTPNPRADRAARARLRRLDGPLAAADPAVIDLYRRWRGDRFDPDDLRLAVRVASVVSHVREEAVRHDGGYPPRFARSLGPSSLGADDGVLKLLRFRSLLAAREEEDVVRRFRRAVALLRGPVNVRDLAGVLIYWDRDETRTRFAFDYFAAGVAAPDGPTPAALLA